MVKIPRRPRNERTGRSRKVHENARLNQEQRKRERLRYLEAPLDLFCGHDSTTLDKAEARSRSSNANPGKKRIDRYDRVQ